MLPVAMRLLVLWQLCIVVSFDSPCCTQGKTAAKIAKIPRLLKKWKGKEAKLIAEVSAKYKVNELSTVGSWRQLLRAMCPVDVSTLLGAQHVEAVGFTVLVVALSTAVILYSHLCRSTSTSSGGRKSTILAEQQEKAADSDELDLWSGDENEDSLY